MAVLLCTLLQGCEPARGTLSVLIVLQDSSGDATTCEALGVATLSVAIYHGSGDSIPYDRADLPCDSGGITSGSIPLLTEVGSYGIVRLSLLGGGGDPVLLCGDGSELEPAVYEQGPVTIEADRETDEQFVVVGQRPPCSAH